MVKQPHEKSRYGRRGRGVKTKAANYRMSTQLLDRLRELAVRTGQSQRYHLEKAAWKYVREEHRKLDDKEERCV